MYFLTAALTVSEYNYKQNFNSYNVELGWPVFVVKIFVCFVFLICKKEWNFFAKPLKKFSVAFMGVVFSLNFASQILNKVISHICIHTPRSVQHYIMTSNVITGLRSRNKPMKPLIVYYIYE